MPDNYLGGDLSQTPGCSWPQEFHINGFLFFFLKEEREREIKRRLWISLSLVLGCKESSLCPKYLSVLFLSGPRSRPLHWVWGEQLRSAPPS
jgi:hypothetical protein